LCGEEVIADVSMEYMENSTTRWEWIDDEYDVKLREWEGVANG